MMQLNQKLFAWENLYDHPSEFIRIDEVLRQKQLSLSLIQPTNTGWTSTAGLEILEHRKILNRMRCYLNFQGSTAFLCKMLSEREIENLKKSTPEQTIAIDEDENRIKSDDELWFLMHANTDKRNTLAFYRVLIEKTIDCELGEAQHNLWCSNKEAVIDEIIKCDFCFE